MTNDNNKRAEARHRCLKEGKIIFSNGNFVVDCIIDNQSEHGAHIRVQNTAQLPKEFLLVEPARSLVHRAMIARRTVKGLGLRLMGPLEDVHQREAYLRRFRR